VLVSDASEGSVGNARLAAGVAVCFLPVVVIALSPWGADSGLVYLGVLPALVALTEGPRVAAGTAVATPVVVLVGLLLSGSPLLGCLWMILVSLGVAWSYRSGCSSAATYVAIAAALALMTAPRSTLLAESASAWSSAAVVAGLALFGGAWVVGIGRAMLTGLPASPSLRPDSATVRRFAAVLSVTVGLSTAVVMTVVPSRNGWWVVLTVLAVVLPDVRTTATRVSQRVIGTAVGGLATGLFLILIDVPTVIRTVGLACALACAVAYLLAPYWLFVGLMTPALALLTFPLETAARAELQRFVFTLAGAVAVVVIGGLTRLILTTGRPPTPV
jgi:Fusaric acid resistance protein-like